MWRHRIIRDAIDVLQGIKFAHPLESSNKFGGNFYFYWGVILSSIRVRLVLSLGNIVLMKRLTVSNTPDEY